MTKEQLEATEIKNEHGNFFPSYTCKEVKTELNVEEVIDYDYTIITTAEEKYQEWLEQQKSQEPQLTLEEQLQEERKRVVSVESLLAEVLKQQAKNTLLK